MFGRRTLALVLLLQASVYAADVVQLKPPSLEDRCLLERVTCTRPMREGRFRIDAEVIDEGCTHKGVVHCYGMGGSGWTTLFGSVGRAIELLDESFPQARGRGYNVVGITASETINMPSWKAAGYFALVSVKTSPEEQANLDQIGLNTFKTYAAIAQGEHPYLYPSAVRYLPVYGSKETDMGLVARGRSGCKSGELCRFAPAKSLPLLDRPGRWAF